MLVATLCPFTENRMSGDATPRLCWDVMTGWRASTRGPRADGRSSTFCAQFTAEQPEQPALASHVLRWEGGSYRARSQEDQASVESTFSPHSVGIG